MVKILEKWWEMVINGEEKGEKLWKIMGKW